MPKGTTAPGKVCPVPSVPTNGLTYFVKLSADDSTCLGFANKPVHGHAAAKGVPNIKRRRKVENGFMSQNVF